MWYRRFIPVAVAWVGLGFYRGVNEYNRTLKSKEHYLYGGAVAYGLFGSVLYTAPPYSIMSLCKEAYRLEVNLRGLESEKKCEWYVSLI